MHQCGNKDGMGVYIYKAGLLLYTDSNTIIADTESSPGPPPARKKRAGKSIYVQCSSNPVVLVHIHFILFYTEKQSEGGGTCGSVGKKAGVKGITSV